MTEPTTVGDGLGEGDGEDEGDADAEAALAEGAPEPLPGAVEAEERAAASTGAGEATATTAAAVPAANTRYEAPMAVPISPRLRRLGDTAMGESAGGVLREGALRNGASTGGAPADGASANAESAPSAATGREPSTPPAAESETEVSRLRSGVSAGAICDACAVSASESDACCGGEAACCGPVSFERSGGMNELSPTPPLP